MTQMIDMYPFRLRGDKWTIFCCPNHVRLVGRTRILYGSDNNSVSLITSINERKQSKNKTTKKLKNCMQLKSMLENTEGGFPFFGGEYFGRSGVIHG